MAFVKPNYSRGQINRAGEIITNNNASDEDRRFADEALANWRAAHGYPINTFQATLRSKLARIDERAIVAQRLKRMPSIVLKLRRFPGMRLARMQDIGGLRAVVSSITRVRKLEESYRTSRFKHELSSSKDYINSPKPDGYRGIHLIYKYSNSRAPDYTGLSVELQLRTRTQHAWATAVETMGTFLGQALKSGQGENQWRDFFALASAALALEERTPPVPGYEHHSETQIRRALRDSERELRVFNKLSGFAVAADRITTEAGKGGYHLIVLESTRRSLTIRPFPISKLEEANLAYAKIEAQTKAGEPVEAVLVSAGPVESLRKAYPNYFLDTHVFVHQLRRFIEGQRRLNRTARTR